MKVFYSTFHLKHNPPFEILDGGERSQSFEVPERVEKIYSALVQESWAEILEPVDFGMEPILAVHDKGYVDFLQTAFQLWTAGDQKFEHAALTPATFPPGGMRRIPHSVLGKAGYYMMDLSAPIGQNTFQAALQSAFCALSGASSLLEGDKSAAALCRPPGHHAGKANCGGYCYLNNAAIAAQMLSRTGKVAVLDIDYHAGNGTQEIFYECSDVLTISLHADPSEEYPYYAGYLDEKGRGAGEGFHANFPMDFGVSDGEYLNNLQDAISLIDNFSPQFLVVSAGMDIFQDDPLGKFKITQVGIQRIGERIAELQLPSLIVLEGGYDLHGLGENFAGFLQKFI